MERETPGLPRPCWALLGIAALLVSGAWAFLASADKLNASTPHIEVPFLLSLNAVLFGASAIVVELVRTARRPREARAARSSRIVFHLLAILALGGGLDAGLVTFVAATFPIC